MKKLFSLICFLIAVFGVKANDSEYFAHGNQLIPLRQNNISVAKEILKIQIENDGFANVDVEYTFDNLSGKEQNILMGFETPTPYFMDGSDKFPESNDYIQDFRINLNGRNIPFKVALVDPDNEVGKDGKIKPIDWSQWRPNENGFGGDVVRKGISTEDPWRDEDHIFCVYAYYFEAKFRPGLNILHHRYRYKMAVGVDYVYRLDYLLTPATRWANGQIGDFTLEIDCRGLMRDFIILGDVFNNCDSEISGEGKRRQSRYYDTPCEEFVLRDASLVFHAKNFQPKGELCLISKCNPSSAGIDLYEGTYNLTPEYLVYDPSNKFFWSLLEYDRDTVQKFPAHTRRIIRNLPYAARGHKFQNKQLADFFSKCFWYMPAENGPDYQAVPLTREEEMITKGYNF